MAVTAISNGIGLNALGSSARFGAFPPNPFAKTETAVPEQSLPGTKHRELSPTGAPLNQPVTGQRKAPVDLPGLITAQQAKAAGQEVEVGGDDKKQNGELSDEDKAVVAKLRARDQEVHRHEQAHAAAGGQYAGAPSYTYQQGPDGKQYAVGGQTPIDASPIPGDPEATVRKMEQVRRAALAPGSPSGADQAIASAATAAALQARQVASAQRRQEAEAAQAETQPQPQSLTGAPQAAAGEGPTEAGAAKPFNAAAAGLNATTTPAVAPPSVQVGAYLQSNKLAMHSAPTAMSCSCLACLPREITSTSF